MSEGVVQDLCLAERILQRRVDPDTGAVDYLVRWQGTDSNGKQLDDSWEPEQHILGEELIEEFERKQAAKRHQRRRSPSRTNGSPYGHESMPDLKESPQYHHPSDPMLLAGMSRRLPSEGPLEHQRQQQEYSMVHPRMPHGPPPPPPFPLPHSGYYPGHPYQYPPMYGHPPQPVPISVKPRPRHTQPKTESLMNDSHDHISTLKRKASLNQVEPAGSQDSANVETGVPAHGSVTTETTKKQRDDHAVRSRDRRLTSSMAGATPATIRLLKLDFDHEKAYFKSVIEKSTLVKGLAARAEMIHFLKDPKSPGSVQGNYLAESETWLVELKRQQEAACSLFLAMDIPKGIVKALFIPEWMLERQRRNDPSKGIVITDPTVVSFIMEGDLHGSGLYPPPDAKVEEEMSISQSSEVAAFSSSQPSQLQPLDPNGDVTMKSAEPNGNLTGSADVSCGWKDCQLTFVNIKELSAHVQREHLKDEFESGSGVSRPGVSVTSPRDIASEASYEVMQDSYRSLSDQIARAKEIAQKMDQQIRESRALYTSAISGSKEHIKRLEAHLEWEMKKWDKYQAQKTRMTTREGADCQEDGDQRNDSAVEAQLTGTLAEPNINGNSKRGSQVPDIETRKLDRPMEAQSMNSIRDIQKLLSDAKENLARLEDDNMALYDKRRTLGSELQALEGRYSDSAAQITSLRDKEGMTLDEIKDRKQNIDDCKATMAKEHTKSREVLGQLQSMIMALKHADAQTPPVQLMYAPSAVDGELNGQASGGSPSITASSSSPTSTAMPLFTSNVPSTIASSSSLPASAPPEVTAPMSSSFSAADTPSSSATAVTTTLSLLVDSMSSTPQPDPSALNTTQNPPSAPVPGSTGALNDPTNFIDLLTKNLTG
ncbi:hypothetical protein BGZ58_003801 [Dissophora ornata]|nr:hypothetical protein BGZ58_003801 [Dissophora ornata]